jgi:hypothetical protein
MKTIPIIFFILLNLSESSYAKMLELKKNLSRLIINQQKGWELKKELFGMPFIYFSPDLNGQRSNISFTDTGGEIKLDSKTLGQTQNDYQISKKQWAKTIGANPLGFIPYQLKINHHGHRVHEIGFNYEHEGKTYSEKSYYIECAGKIIYSKSLRLIENEAHEKNFYDLIQNLNCSGV